MSCCFPTSRFNSLARNNGVSLIFIVCSSVFIDFHDAHLVQILRCTNLVGNCQLALPSMCLNHPTSRAASAISSRHRHISSVHVFKRIGPSSAARLAIPSSTFPYCSPHSASWAPHRGPVEDVPTTRDPPVVVEKKFAASSDSGPHWVVYPAGRCWKV